MRRSATDVGAGPAAVERPPSRPLSRAVAAGLLYLAGSAVTVGLWAQLAPRSFYDDFPGVRRFWVSLDGPYNEHLIRDIGGLNLSLALLTMAAVGLRASGLAPLAAGCWLVYGFPHLGYHLTHLAPYEPVDAAAQAAALATQVLVPLLVLAVHLRPGWHRDRMTRSAA
ncbi:hypothetical protein [Nocardioides deserti]|uniref:Uncharacterized protein n=1 Tax=Nocardioides deserti TaxID=1588644 RepID=A0ABR6U4P7_9ACTN|nr:hypothetical protein [Nocardioides deserti]MBC2959399.1 hypothetical protein [Nocardioides deserti]GGO73394.1 hypothetical protein GCM10012276_18880 [Nocardioides deserti]